MPNLERESFNLPESATIKEINTYAAKLKKAAGILNHSYLELRILSSQGPWTFATDGKYRYKVEKVVLACISPLTCRRKVKSILAPKDRDFVVSVNLLKKKISELEDFYQSEIERKKQKNSDAQKAKDFFHECIDIGLPMALHQFLQNLYEEVNNG